MKLSRQEFKQLQSEWYDLLEKSGFKDIEEHKDGEPILSQTASCCYRGADEFEREMKSQYFRTIAQAVHDENTVFRNEIDRYILVRHAEGAKIKDIKLELMALGGYRCRNSICFIIRRYEAAWGIRYYDDKKLNIKRKA